MKTEFHPIVNTGEAINDVKWPIDPVVIPNRNFPLTCTPALVF
jgi:hypothetical protein